MDKFILTADEEKKVYFEVAAAELNIMPQLIEKDFWVCWILKTLFSLKESGSHLTFKGGTSLSKCYKVIRRFSEDIDVSIERSFLSGGEAIEPDKEKSNKENRRRLKELQLACKTNIKEIILPELIQKIKALFANNRAWKIELDPDDENGQTVLFFFPNVTMRNTESYVKPAVKIEFGARSAHWPVENRTIFPYISNVSGKLAVGGVTVRVLAAERTFWEKATILHTLYHYPPEKKLPLRMARHYYDLFMMAESIMYKKALASISLLKNVSQHKSLFFKSGWAHYDEAKPGSLKLVPHDVQINQLKIDYRQMQQMFFDEPPQFENIIEKLKSIEEDINSLTN